MQHTLRDIDPVDLWAWNDWFGTSNFEYTNGVNSATAVPFATEYFDRFNILDKDKQKSVPWDGCWIKNMGRRHCLSMQRLFQVPSDAALSWISDQLGDRYIHKQIDGLL